MQIGTPGHTGAAPARQANFFHGCLLLSTVICGTLAATVIGPVLPAMQRHFADIPHVTTLVPVVVTLPMLVLAALAIFIGWVADHVGRKRIMVGGLVLYAIAGTAPLYLDSIYLILASRALVGVAEAAVMTCSTTMIGDYFTGNERDRYVSLQTTFASVSAFIFNLMGGILGEHGWRVPFAVYALTLALAPLVQIFIWEPARHPTQERRAQPPCAARNDAEPEFSGWLLAQVCVVSFLAGVVFLMVPVHLAFMLVELGVHAPKQIGMSYAMNSLGVILGTLSFGWLLVGRFQVMHQLLLGTVVCGLGFMLMGGAHDYASMTLGATVNGFGCGLVLPAATGWALRTLPFARRALGIGAFMASQFLGYFCNPLIVMPMVAHMGSRLPVVNIWGILLIVVAIVVLIGSFGTHRRKLSKQSG
ncbi:MAG: MFS transporter [Janthinobacterium lividum]